MKTGVFFTSSAGFSAWFCDGATADWSKDDLGEEASGDSRGMATFHLVTDVISIFKDGSRLCTLLDGRSSLTFELLVSAIIEAVWRDICECCWDKSCVSAEIGCGV